ncbi:hypothetical protein IFO70_10410 [Phormidium tenue FACHB-886]|nr:hypothetical protein [Phormidium tenue FACHB-886]
MPTYDARAGQYRGENGRFVPRLEIMRLLDQEAVRTQTQLRGHTRLLIGGKLDLAEWESRTAATLKAAHLRIASLAAGGKGNLSPKHYGAIGYQLRGQYEYLDKFANDLAAGKLTPNQALRRSAQYGQSIRKTFHRAEQITRGSEGFSEAKRSLDPQAKHCASCLAHSTRGRWKPIAEVVLPGAACACGQFCRCSIVYRYRRESSKQAS